MPESQMIINYVPGEECRVAIVEDGKLEELHVERFAQASRVGNIYAGVVVNVEPAIQAAFVDFGVEDNGFLHVTDLHPKYFPGEDDETTERVGFKTPRRERPPIQACLRRGDEVLVQVLKEGVGTKGPTVTSYLSIPGRFLVMMPGMDRVGVSRKVEDEEQRREMRQILDQLELPEGFGFILRTAGMDRNKAELKRDLAYLQRLWKDMEKREKSGPRGKPRLLYSESDLLVRALRDQLTADIGEVIVDHELALNRAARFMKIVAPRSSTKLFRCPGGTPIFHAFGIEKQIALIHAREVPLPSGGRLVIDQTEALVAIDVNSGKSRESRNSEDNAYQTNVEAVDEICRQLRLRDMGGIIINDLIDMRHASHRKDIENRFKERLKRDRAKSTVASISEFGILEMTRQRMRPSHESVHFTDCPMCRGRGMLQRPDSVAGDGLRDLAAILDAQRAHRVEMVVAPRVAGELLSTKRGLLGRIERASGKHVDVRVSESVPVDRVSFYAYDAQGADIDLSNLPQPRRPKDLIEWVDDTPKADWAMDEAAEQTAAAEPEPEPQVEDVSHPIEFDVDDDEPAGAPNADTESEPGEGGRRRRRRRRRGRGGRAEGESAPRVTEAADPRADPQASPAHEDDDAALNGQPPDHHQGHAQAMSPDASSEQGTGGRRRRRRRRGRGGQSGPDAQRGGRDAASRPIDPRDAAPVRRDLSPETGGEWGDDAALPKRPPAEPELPVPRAREHDAPPAPPLVLVEDAEGDDRDDSAPGDFAGDGEPAQPGEPGEGGRRRRRRRRRRGKGGGGNAEGAAPNGDVTPSGQPHGQSQAQPQGRPPRPHQDRPPQDRGAQRPARDGRAPQGGGNQGPRQARPPQSRPAPERPPQPRPAPAEPTPPKVRTLYGAVRRKLSTAELNKRPKPE